MWRILIVFESFSLSTRIRTHSSALCFWQKLWLLIMRKVVCWHHFLCFVNELHERVFQGARSIGHVDLKTGSDSVTLANSKICWYDHPHASEFAAYSKICTLDCGIGGKMWIQIFPDMCRHGLKVTTVFFVRFQKVILKCFFLTKMPKPNKSLRCTKKNNNNQKETQWNVRFTLENLKIYRHM